MPHTVEQSQPHQTLHQQSTTQHKIHSTRPSGWPVRARRQRVYEVVKRLQSWDWPWPHCEHSREAFSDTQFTQRTLMALYLPPWIFNFTGLFELLERERAWPIDRGTEKLWRTHHLLLGTRRLLRRDMTWVIALPADLLVLLLVDYK